MDDSRRRLYQYGDIYDHRATDRLFLGAVRENVRFHHAHNAAYRRMLEEMGFSVKEVEREADLHRIPPIPTAFFKRHTLWTMDPG
ncbi:MAG: acyl-protein synthetase, partial [Clostridium sp.]|nr:acyl-protein synthetase [Clostridium sp.]